MGAHGITDITDMDTMDITAVITDITVDAETTKEHLYHALANKKQYDNYLGLTGCTNTKCIFLMRLTKKHIVLVHSVGCKNLLKLWYFFCKTAGKIQNKFNAFL